MSATPEDRGFLAAAGIADLDEPSNDMGVPDRAPDGRACGPLAPEFWERKIDPFEDQLSATERHEAALRVRATYAALLGARGGRAGKGRKRPPKTSEAAAA